MVYIFIGQDNPAKEIQLKNIRQKHLSQDLEDFNLDIIYAKEAKLKSIQEVFLSLPVNSDKRLVVIKDAGLLAKDAKEFILRYLKKSFKQIILVMDFEHYDRKDDFLTVVSRYGKVTRFKESIADDTFSLLRQIESGKAAPALGILTNLLREGERPERILGGLRYAWEKQEIISAENKRRLRFLLEADIDIKKGRLKPAFALEKLVINLCAFTKLAH